MKKLTATALLAAGLLSAATLPAAAQTPPPSAPASPDKPGTEVPPGYKDFEDGDLSPRDVEELEDRRDDRNVVSPGTRDEQELDSEMGVDR